MDRRIVGLGVMVLLACAKEQDAPVPTAPAPVATDDSLCGPAYPAYSPGMAVKVGALTAKLVAVEPSPPRQKVPNHWTLEVLSEDGTVLPDVTLANPDSFMPVHNHHGRTQPTIGTASAPARKRIEAIDFQMRGPWQVLVDVERAGARVGTATFQVCVR